MFKALLFYLFVLPQFTVTLWYLPYLVDLDLITFAYFATRLWSHLPSLSQSATSSTASSAPHLMFWGASRWTDCHPSAGVGGGGAAALWAVKWQLWEGHGPTWPPVNSGELSRLRLGSIITTACRGESLILLTYYLKLQVETICRACNVSSDICSRSNKIFKSILYLVHFPDLINHNLYNAYLKFKVDVNMWTHTHTDRPLE